MGMLLFPLSIPSLAMRTTFHTPGAVQDAVALHEILLPLLCFGGIDLDQALTSKLWIPDPHFNEKNLLQQRIYASMEHVSSGLMYLPYFSRMRSLKSWPALDIHPVVARTDLLLPSNPAGVCFPTAEKKILLVNPVFRAP